MSILENDSILKRTDEIYNKYLELNQEGIGQLKVSLCLDKQNTSLYIPLWKAGSEVDIELGLVLKYKGFGSRVETEFGSSTRLNYYSNITEENDIYTIADSNMIKGYYELSTEDNKKYNPITDKYLIKEGNVYFLCDRDGNKICYPSTDKNYPSYIESVNGNKISFTVNSDGNISEITNNRDLKVVFTYNSNKLVSDIKYYRYNTSFEEIYRIGFTYKTTTEEETINGKKQIVTRGNITKIQRGYTSYLTRCSLNIS